MKSTTSPTPTGKHHTPRLIERTDTGPQLPRPLDQPPAPQRAEQQTPTIGERSQTHHQHPATAQDFQDALEPSSKI